MGVISIIIYIYEGRNVLVLGVEPVESPGGLHKSLVPAIPLVECEAVPVGAVIGNKVVVFHSCGGQDVGNTLRVIPY